MERVLILDTSGGVGRVALAEDGDVVDDRVLAESRRHARDLPAAIKSMLDARGWKPRQITATIACVGPGSYTGLRVGIAAVKAFAYATECALFAVPLFDAIAMGIEASEFDLTVVSDALRGNLYASHYRWTATSGWQLQEPIAIVAAVEWASGLRPGARVAGPGLGHATALLGERGIALVGSESATPGNFLEAVHAHSDRYRSDPWRIEPIYLRGSSAEEKRKRETDALAKGLPR